MEWKQVWNILFCVQWKPKINGEYLPQSLLHLISWGGLSLNLGLTVQLDGLAGWWALGICLSPSPQSWTTGTQRPRGAPPHLALYMAAGNPHPGPHAWVASTLPTDPRSQSLKSCWESTNTMKCNPPARVFLALGHKLSGDLASAQASDGWDKHTPLLLVQSRYQIVCQLQEAIGKEKCLKAVTRWHSRQSIAPFSSSRPASIC